MKLQPVWEKTYYGPTYFDNAHRRDNGKETGDWSGILLTYKFLIKPFKARHRLLIEPGVAEFRGKDEEEMLADLEKQVEGMEEWSGLGDKHYREAEIFPPEVEAELKKYNIKYKK